MLIKLMGNPGRSIVQYYICRSTVYYKDYINFVVVGDMHLHINLPRMAQVIGSPLDMAMLVVAGHGCLLD